MKKIIRLTESDLHRLVKESVKRIIKEGYGDFDEDPMYRNAQENEMWYQKALDAFEQQGIEVPQSVISILAKEMKKKHYQDRENNSKNSPEVRMAEEICQKLGLKLNVRYINNPEEEYLELEAVTQDNRRPSPELINQFNKIAKSNPDCYCEMDKDGYIYI